MTRQGYFVEIKLKGRLVLALSVPVLDCIRVPGALGAEPVAVDWVVHKPYREWRAEYRAVVGTPDSYAIERFEFIARRFG